jgi:hypothetical protein
MEKNMSGTRFGVYLTQEQIAVLLFTLDGAAKATDEAIESGIQEIEDSEYIRNLSALHETSVEIIGTILSSVRKKDIFDKFCPYYQYVMTGCTEREDEPTA